MTKEDALSEEYGCKVLQGFNDAIKGITSDCDRLVYSYESMVDVLMNHENTPYGEAMPRILEEYVSIQEELGCIIMEELPKHDSLIKTVFADCFDSIVLDGFDKAMIGITAGGGAKSILSMITRRFAKS